MVPDPGGSRLLFAFAASLLLHGALLLSMPQAQPVPAPEPLLQARLLLAPEMEAPVPALLHDTLREELPPAEAAPPAAPEPVRAAIEPARPPAAPPPADPQTKAAEQLYYPPQAVAAGIQGEVRVRITVDTSGAVADARIARGSGHAVLDAAALRAAAALGNLPGVPAGELVLPVIFRLQ